MPSYGVYLSEHTPTAFRLRKPHTLIHAQTRNVAGPEWFGCIRIKTENELAIDQNKSAQRGGYIEA